jgi:predicted amidohydrolase
MKIAMAQMSMSNSIDDNFEKTISFINQSKDCDLLFFPEVQVTPFFAQYKIDDLKMSKDELSIALDDEKIEIIKSLAKENNIYISPNFYVNDNGKYYDMSLMIDNNGDLIEKSKMVHIAQAEYFYEQDYYTPSDDGFKVVDTPFGKVGIVICFDRHIPQSIQSCAIKGAQLVIIPTANTIAEPMDMFEKEIQVQAYQNNVFIAMCNRVGKEDKMDFAGQSLIVDCDGNTLLKADDKEQLIKFAVDLSKAIQNQPYTELLRPNMYK